MRFQKVFTATKDGGVGLLSVVGARTWGYQEPAGAAAATAAAAAVCLLISQCSQPSVYVGCCCEGSSLVAWDIPTSRRTIDDVPTMGHFLVQAGFTHGRAHSPSSTTLLSAHHET